MLNYNIPPISLGEPFTTTQEEMQAYFESRAYQKAWEKGYKRLAGLSGKEFDKIKEALLKQELSNEAP